jgi:peptide/nickel transport system substrate-binding protein
MMRHRPGRVILSVLLSFSALAAERAVIYLRLTDSLTLDPGKTEDFFSQEVLFNVFEGLVQLNKAAMAVEPCLAESWRAEENGRRWIFHLRRGVRFHNGLACNARAVVYSFTKRIQEKQGAYAPFGKVFPFIAAVKARDDWTVEIILTRPYFSFLFSLVDQRASVVAPGTMDGPQFKPIGTGPFAFSEWNRGKSLALVRNEDYWQRPARLARIIFKYEPNETLRLSQIKNRAADIDFIRSAKEYEELLGKTGIGILIEPKPITYYLGFNCRRAPFSRLQVRQAFAHLLDKKVLVKQVFQNLAVAADGMLPPQMPGLGPQSDNLEFSPEKARGLLAEAGIGDGFSCSLYYSQGQFGIEEMAQAIAAGARRIHVTVNTVKLPFDKLLPAVQNGEPDLFLVGWGYTGDAGIFLNPLFMLYPGSPKNAMAAGPEFVRLLARAEGTSDDKKRWELYAAAERRLREDLPLIPLFHLNHVMAYNKRLRGLRMNPLGFLIFRDASLAAD